jgi:hypothetical protein
MANLLQDTCPIFLIIHNIWKYFNFYLKEISFSVVRVWTLPPIKIVSLRTEVQISFPELDVLDIFLVLLDEAIWLGIIFWTRIPLRVV